MLVALGLSLGPDWLDIGLMVLALKAVVFVALGSEATEFDLEALGLGDIGAFDLEVPGLGDIGLMAVALAVVGSEAMEFDVLKAVALRVLESVALVSTVLVSTVLVLKATAVLVWEVPGLMALGSEAMEFAALGLSSSLDTNPC